LHRAVPLRCGQRRADGRACGVDRGAGLHSYVAAEDGWETFFGPDRCGVVRFTRWLGYYAYNASGLLAPPEERSRLLEHFRQFLDLNRLNGLFICIGRDQLPLFREQGCQVSKNGEEPLVRLETATWRGKEFEWLRRQENFCLRENLEVVEIDPDPSDPNYRDILVPQLEEVSREHIEATLHGFEMRYLVGRFTPFAMGHKRLFAAVKGSGLSCFWAFLGAETAAAAAAVVRDPVRNVPRATLLGVAGVTVLYIAVTAVLMGLMPAARLASSNAPFADAAQVLVGAGVGSLIAVCMALRATGCLTGWMLVTAETSRGAADVGDFPKIFRTRPGEHASLSGLLIPGSLMTLEAVLTAQPNLAQQFSTLTNVTSLLCIFTYVMAASSLIRISRGRPIAIVSAAVAILGALALLASAKPLELELSLLPLAAAGLLHLWLRRR